MVSMREKRRRLKREFEMKICPVLTLLMGMILLMGCSSENVQPEDDHCTLRVPIEVAIENNPIVQSRTMGDPGYNDELQPPKHLYIFAWIQTGTNNYELLYIHRKDIVASEWSYLPGVSGEDNTARYQLNENLYLTFSSQVMNATEKTNMGRIYAIASSRPFTLQQLETMLGDTYKNVLTSPVPLKTTTSPDMALQAALVDLADWTGEDLRDLYSNPLGDPQTDLKNIANGRIVYTAASASKAYVGDVRLYHCAAKIDFTWEVAPELRNTTSVRRITIKELPTICKLFEPTKNRVGHKEQSIMTTPPTKWTGREYIYALQPQNGSIKYDVDFDGRTGITDKTFSPTSPNPTFTGWYRVIATIK